MKKTNLLLALLLLLPHGSLRGQEETPAKPPPTRYLLLCLDGVGYGLVRETHRKGELRNFLPPAPLITAFPTLTNTGLVEVLEPLGAEPARGYEDRYFDSRANRLRGTVFHRLSQKYFVESTFRGLFHYHPNSIRMTFEYALPVMGPWLNGAVSLHGIKKKFLASEEPIFLAYFDSSDLAAHLYGQWLVRRQLRALDRWAGKLRSEAGQPVEVIVFSDHGNHRGRMRRVDLKSALRAAGFRPEGKLRDERSVVMAAYGLVSAAALYTPEGQEAAVAQALQQVEGVDLVAHRQDGVVHVAGRAGSATIERRESQQGARFRYRAEAGDPLRLECRVEELEAAGRADADGFIAESDWLRATADHIYPDPLRRLWAAFDGLVEHPAGVIVSLEEDYYAGSPLLDLFAWLQATHGSLRREQSRGMVLSTDPALLLPYRGPFTGKNLLPRVRDLLEPPAAGEPLDFSPEPLIRPTFRP